MLTLAGCGVHPGSFTRELLEALEEADIIYVELYTMPLASWILDHLKPWAGKVRVADRRLLEENSRIIVEEAVSRHVLVLSAGDPLIATTHHSLLAEASRVGVKTRYIPGVSGVCIAKAYSGLSYYRFGRTATIPGPWRGFKPYSVLAVVYANLCIDAHTLLLLDVSSDGTQLDPRIAASILLGVEGELSQTLGFRKIVEVTPVIVVEKAGSPDASIRVYGSARELSTSEGYFRAPSSMIIPAPLSKTELWILESRLGVKLDQQWLMRPYGRSECCRLHELLLEWLKVGYD